MVRALPPVALSAALAVCLMSGAATARPTVVSEAAAHSSLWRRPADITERDLFNGSWGAERAPKPNVAYRLVARKHSGINPGMTVLDPDGRKWSVKQAPPEGQPSEGPIEVVVSRLLSAVGYHQPPVYYLPSFRLVDDWGTRVEGEDAFGFTTRR